MNKLSGLVLLLLFSVSCAKQENYLPDVPVNFSAPLTDPRLSRLSVPGGAVSLDNYGIAGIIIFRGFDNAYIAYDRCSTVNPEQKNAVRIDDPAITATDPVSGAQFSLIDGGPQKAPAIRALKRYNVTISGNTIRVMN